MKLTLLFFLSFFLLNFIPLAAQTEEGNKSYIPNITATTPQVAALSKVGEIPIDISTGRINYTIPIFEVKEGDFTMPINLSYNYSGLLLDETPGHAGVGWTLNIGGSILHTINGLDDYNNEHSKAYIDDYFYSRPPFNFDSPNLESKISDLLMMVSKGSIDGEPDKYTINVGNINSVFYIDKNGNPVFIKNENYKVTRLPNSGFKVIDDKGVNYIFDLALRAYKAQGDNTFSYTSAYLLTEINFPNTNNTILFQYDSSNSYTERYLNETLTTTTDQFSNVSPSSSLEMSETNIDMDVINLKKIISNKYIIELSYDYNPVERGIGVIKNLIIKNNINNETKNYSFLYSKWYGRRTNLLSVSYNNEIINQMEYDMTIDYPLTSDLENTYFKKDLWGYYNNKALRPTRSTNPLSNPSIKPDFESTKIGALKKITYQTKGYSLIDYEQNEVFFHQNKISYLPYNPSTTSYQNFTAKTDQKLGGINEKTFEIKTVPAYIDISHYNLSNNIENKDVYEKKASVSLFLEGDELTPIFQDNQDWDWEMEWRPPTRSKSGSKARIKIDKIGIYHLKSVSTIGAIASIAIEVAEFPLAFNESVGGIRVNKIQDCDFNGQCITTTYSFSQNGQSTGLMIQRPNFHSSFFIEDDRNCAGGTYNRYDYYTFNSVYPLSEYKGSSVLYKIVEKNNIFSNISNGKTIFTYLGGSSIFPSEDKLIKIGLLESEIVNDQSNELVKKNKNYYITEPSPSNSKYVASLQVKHIMQKKNQFSFGNQSSCAISFPKPITDFQERSTTHKARNYILEKQETTNYYGNKEVVQNTINKYNFDTGNLKNQTISNSKGEIVETKYFYAQDSEVASEPFVNELKDKNIVGVPLTTLTYNGTTKLSEQKTVYDRNLATSNLLLPRYIYANKGVDNINNNIDKKITFDQYDDKGNLLQYTPEGGIPVSIIWGYNKTQPIAKIENVKYSSISESTIANLQRLSNEDSDNCLSDNCTEELLRKGLATFRNSFPDAFISTYTYNPLIGVTSITDPKGVPSYYEYDLFNRLKFVKDKDLNVLQKYCYNYKGQQVDCSDNTSSTIVLYKSIARSGPFAKNNCPPGSVASSIVYNQVAGASTSTISQADADSLGLTKFNSDGQANANANANCTFSSIARSDSFIKNNCAPGGVGSSVAYTQVAGAIASTISQANADAVGLTKFNLDGQANANANGYCTFNSIARSGPFAKNNCPSGYIGSSIIHNQVAGAITSKNSQAEADSSGLTKFNSDGQANANANGVCNIPPPTSPTGLTFISATTTSLNFSWTTVAGATSYKIYKNGSDTGITYSTSTGSLSGLTASTSYNIQVLAVNSSGNSPLSTALKMTTASEPITNNCSVSFNRVSGSFTMFKNDTKYLSSSSAGTYNGTLTTGDTFYVVLSGATKYYKTITIMSSIRGILYDYGPNNAGSSVTTPLFTKEGAEVITINCVSSDMQRKI